MGWTNRITHRQVVFLFGLLLALYIVFPGKLYSLNWIFAAVFIFLFAVILTEQLSVRWISVIDTSFTSKLFISSLLIRLASMFILLLVSYKTWGLFYTVGARDEMVYFRVASEAAVIWKTQTIGEAYLHVFASYNNELSDTGFPTFLMILMRIFNHSELPVKILLCFIGSFSVIRGYRLASMVIDEAPARLAGVLLMLYPISWFYSGILLKESLMVLLIIETLIQIIQSQNRFSFLSFIKILFLIILIFFFRSAISILLIMVLGFSYFIQYKRKNYIFNSILIIFLVLIYIFFLKSTGRFDEYYDLYTSVNEYTEQRLSYMENINPFVAVLGSPAFAVLSFISPFPSVVRVPNAGGLPHSEYYYHVAGNIFWICLSFFSFYGIFHAMRHRRKEMAAIIAFVIGYQFVLLKAMMFTSVRFSYPAKPLLLILAAYGIYKMKNKKWYPFYLIAMALMIIGWNYVRLRSRA